MNRLAKYIVLLVTIPLIQGVYYERNGTKYFISFPMMKNWHQALRYCTLQGMHLLTINTPEENDIVLEVINQFNATSPHVHFWTSGTDAGHVDKDWYWIESGFPILYTNWLDGAPSSSDRDCILLHGGVHKFKWYDQDCKAVHHFICQNRLILPDTLKNQQCQNEL